MFSTFTKYFNRLESFICRILLASFVILLFIQILLREFFNYTIPWGEELATYMFVWFVFFGASYAALLAAHNRVTFQFKLLPKKVAMALEGLADLIWLCFNIYFVYISIDFVFFKMNVFWKSQTIGVPMKYFYMILPLAFSLMSIRILQVNYYKFIKGVEVRDPEELEVEKILETGSADADGKPSNSDKG